MGKTLTWLFPLLLKYIHVLEEFTARHVHHPHVTVGCHNVLQQFDIFVVLLASQYTTRFDVLKGYLLSSVDNPKSKIHELIANKTSLKKSYMPATLTKDGGACLLAKNPWMMPPLFGLACKDPRSLKTIVQEDAKAEPGIRPCH